MRLSVVIPAHDAEPTIQAAIRSALAQRVAPDEIVVVDDGSTDTTATVVRAFGDPVRLVRRDRSGGPSAARNTGVEASAGQWIAFLDADDEWHPEKLELQLRLAGEGVVLVATDWARTLPDGPVPSDVPTSEITAADLLLLNRFQTSTVLLDRRTFDAVGGFDPGLDGVEDWDMWLRCARRGRVVKVDLPLVRYADSPSGYSKALDRVYRTGWSMLERELAASGRRGDTVLAWHHLRFAVAYFLARDRVSARSCLVDCRRAGRTRGAPEAVVRYLLPFLVRRAERRARHLWGHAFRAGGGTRPAQ